jgi:hypothetical protein
VVATVVQVVTVGCGGARCKEQGARCEVQGADGGDTEDLGEGTSDTLAAPNRVLAQALGALGGLKASQRSSMDASPRIRAGTFPDPGSGARWAAGARLLTGGGRFEESMALDPGGMGARPL